MSHDLTDDSADHEAERMIFEMDQKHAQALRMKRYRFRKKAGFKRGGTTKAYAKGGSVSGRSSVSASSRGDGIAQRGKTRGKMC